MSDNKVKRSTSLENEVRNPRYEGATPEIVTFTLMQHQPQLDEGRDDA